MAEGRRAHAGGIVELVEFLGEHRTALTFDFRHFFAQSLDRVGFGEVTYGEARRLVLGLMRDSRSHLYAEMAGQTAPGSHADAAVVLLAESYVNVHRDPKKLRDPLSMPGPWMPKPANSDLTVERRAELESQLRRRSAFT